MGHYGWVSLRHLAAATLVLVLAATAAAQCVRGPRTSEVTLPDFLAVYFDDFRSFSAEDAAEFYGGVCVTAVGGEWTVITEEVRLDDLSGDIRLRAPEPTLYLGEWQIHADLLEADTHALALQNAELEGPDASGSAERLTLDLATGEMTLVGLSLAGSAFAVRGELAVLEGTALRVERAGLTTCIGMEVAPYEVEGEVALVDLGQREVRIRSGSLRVGRVTVPLRDEVVVSEAAFADFELPVRVAFVAGGPERAGAGLDVRVVGIPAAPGVDLVVGATGLDEEHVTRGVVLLELEGEVPEAVGSSQVSAVVGVEASAPYLDLEVVRGLTGWLDLELGVAAGARAAKAARYEGRLGLSAAAPLPLAAVPSLSGSVGADLFTAATAVTAGATEPQPQAVGPRLGGAASANLAWRATPGSTFALTVGAEATYYPATWASDAPAEAAWQWGARLNPRWRYAGGPLVLALSYDARFTNAGSPFGAAVDRLTPLQRLEGNVQVAGALAVTEAGAWTGALGATAVYDPLVTSTPAGLKRLTLDGSVVYGREPWTFRAAAKAELSGLLAATGRDPYVELDLTAARTGWPVFEPGAEQPAVPHGTFEVGLLTRYSLEPAAEGLELLELGLAVPLAFDTFELRPYLAFDFAPTLLEGAAPGWSGYGLDATFITCCGSFTVGLMNDRGAFTAGIGIDLERRPPPAPVIMPADR